MDFWSQYITESLQSPWFIKTESEASQPVLQKRIFVVSDELPDEAFTMLGRMIAALKYGPEEVTVLSDGPDDVETLEALDESRWILFFGEEFPGRFGETLHWAGHQVIQTHGLQSLLRNPDLKKQTWQHLKNFASLK